MKKHIKSETSIEPKLLVCESLDIRRKAKRVEEEGEKWFNKTFWFPPGMEIKSNCILSWKQNSASFAGLQLSLKQKIRPY